MKDKSMVLGGSTEGQKYHKVSPSFLQNSF